MWQKLKLHVEFCPDALFFYAMLTDAERLFTYLQHARSTSWLRESNQQSRMKSVICVSVPLLTRTGSSRKGILRFNSACWIIKRNHTQKSWLLHSEMSFSLFAFKQVVFWWLHFSPMIIKTTLNKFVNIAITKYFCKVLKIFLFLNFLLCFCIQNGPNS